MQLTQPPLEAPEVTLPRMPANWNKSLLDCEVQSLCHLWDWVHRIAVRMLPHFQLRPWLPAVCQGQLSLRDCKCNDSKLPSGNKGCVDSWQNNDAVQRSYSMCGCKFGEATVPKSEPLKCHTNLFMLAWTSGTCRCIWFASRCKISLPPLDPIKPHDPKPPAKRPCHLPPNVVQACLLPGSDHCRALLKHDQQIGVSYLGCKPSFVWKGPTLLPQVKTKLFWFSIKWRILLFLCCHMWNPSGADGGSNLPGVAYGSNVVSSISDPLVLSLSELDVPSRFGGFESMMFALGKTLWWTIEGSTGLDSSSSLMTIGSELWAVTCCMTRPLLVSSGRNKPSRTSHNSCSRAEMLAAAPSLEYVRPMRNGWVWYPSCNLRLISSPRLAAYDNVVVFKEWLATLRPSTGNASPNKIKRNQPAASWLSKGLAPGWPSGWGAGITPSLLKSKDKQFLTSSHSSIQLLSTKPFAVATIGKNWWRCCCDCIVLWDPTRASR